MKTIRGDLHIHSMESDGCHPIHEIINRYCVDFLAIADHDILSQDTINRCMDETSKLCIPGEEITVENTHILGLGLNSRISGTNKTVEEIFDEIHAQDGLAIIPHPKMSTLPGLMLRLSSKLDAIEYFNSRFEKTFLNWELMQFAIGHKIPGIFSSDMHKFYHLMDASTLISKCEVEDDFELTQESLFNLVKTNKFRPEDIIIVKGYLGEFWNQMQVDLTQYHKNRNDTYYVQKE